jgi:LemA protein
MTAVYIIIGIVALILFYVIVTYNGLVRFRNQMKNAWAQIDVQLKRRHDLIPNLVNTVKGYAAHERETLEAVTNARNVAQGAVGKGVGAQSVAEGILGEALSRLLVVVENYPDLKANQNFLALQEELASTENKIAFSRQFYNDSVLHYNNKIHMFPSNIIAGMGSFKDGEFFEIEAPAEKETPRVSFG